MARILITGSADGLGLMAARLLIDEDHEVVLHGRNPVRAREALLAAPGAAASVEGDLSAIAGMRQVAEQATTAGPFDAVIHNAGVGYRESSRIATADGLAHVFAINVLAPYLLTALVPLPSALVYLSSGMNRGGSADLEDAQWIRRPWNGAQAYSDSKLFDILLACGVARRYSYVRSNSVEPGWVATKMGGPGAPGDLSLAAVTQAWLAAGADPATHVSGHHFYHQQDRAPNPRARSEKAQDALLDYCGALTGTPLPL